MLDQGRQDPDSGPAGPLVFYAETQSNTMRGTARKISVPRRLVADLMHASIRVPFVSLARPLNIRGLVEARAQAVQPPGWAAIFVKAFALVAKSDPVLRTLYVKWPSPGFYELPRSVAMVAIARVENGEDCVLPQKVTAPEEMPLREVDRLIRHAKQAADRRGAGVPEDAAGDAVAVAAAAPALVDRPQCRTTARQLLWQLWGDLGRGATGLDELHALSPGPFVLSYGAEKPDQTIDVVVRWDHRITDAALMARTLTRLEHVLNTEIAAELRAIRAQTEPKPVRAVAT